MLPTLLFLSWSLVFLQVETDGDIREAFHLLEAEGPVAALKWVEAQGKTPYQFASNLRKSGKHALALKWSVAMIKVSTGQKKAKFFFSKAWTHYRLGEMEQAVEDGFTLLEVGPNKSIEANTHYMLAMIFSDQEQYDNSYEHFLTAEQIYTELERMDDVFLCVLGLAEIEILKRNYEKGKNYLSQSLQMKTNHSKGRVHDLESVMYFQKAEYHLSILASQKAIEEYERKNNLHNILWQNIRIGLCHALLGNFGDAYDFAAENDAIAQKEDNLVAGYYNSITWMLMDRCQGYEYRESRKMMLDWAKHNKSKHIKDLLLLVESVSCPP